MSKKKQPSGSSKVERPISRWTKFFGFSDEVAAKDKTQRGHQETKAEKPK